MIIKDKNKLKLKAGSKILVLGLIILFILLASARFGLAVTCTAPNTPAGCTPAATADTNTNYQLLAPLPTGTNSGPMSTYPTGDGSGVGGYLNVMIRLFIGICAVLSVVMIVIGGIEYMTTELISSKEEGKKRITNAILGLLLALGAWTLLYTINPDLLKSDVNIPSCVLPQVLKDGKCANP